MLRIIAFVFGLKAASSSLGSIFQPLAERQLSFDYEFKDDYFTSLCIKGKKVYGKVRSVCFSSLKKQNNRLMQCIQISL